MFVLYLLLCFALLLLFIVARSHPYTIVPREPAKDSQSARAHRRDKPPMPRIKQPQSSENESRVTESSRLNSQSPVQLSLEQETSTAQRQQYPNSKATVAAILKFIALPNLAQMSSISLFRLDACARHQVPATKFPDSDVRRMKSSTVCLLRPYRLAQRDAIDRPMAVPDICAPGGPRLV
jgi:hypothetical protein